MARHTIAEPRVQELAARLVNLVLRVGSVRAVHKTIEGALSGTDVGGTVYPNRIHALLSEDTSRGVNTATIELLELAFSRLPAAEADGEASTLRADILHAYDTTVAGEEVSPDAAVRRVTEETDLPPAVVKAVLSRAGRLQSQSVKNVALGAPKASGRPDWSFQDVAIDRIVAALKSGPNAKVGAVIPTGGGKTRIAMSVALRELRASSRDDAVILWVTHRRRLQVQARRELQRALGSNGVAAEDVSLFESGLKIIMVSDLEKSLRENEGRIRLVIVDEAHHAAAPSYRHLFQAKPQRGLFLTATPNRADNLPIGIDRIAYSTTYRELFGRGVIVEPVFEAPQIDGLDFSRGRGVGDLADYLLQRTEEDLRKVMVAVTRKEYAESLYDAVQEAFSNRDAHPLGKDDVIFVHGDETSTGGDPDDLLDEFVARPRGILIATSQLIGEGFDDPSIDGVVITYPSESIGHLMQLAGRALRWAEGKNSAHIVQVRHSPLAYHFEQRWLYQDISDRLRPQLLDCDYAAADDLREQVARRLRDHHVPTAVQERLLAELGDVAPGEPYNLLLSGLPFYGKGEEFREAPWGAVLVTPEERERFVRIFNDFSDRGAEVNSFHDFLRNYISPDQSRGSLWKSYLDMLAAMDSARKELDGLPYEGGSSRPYSPNRGTSWLTYVTFEYRPALPAALSEFLADAVNRDEVSAKYLTAPADWKLALKVPLPLAGTLAFLLNEDQAAWLESKRGDLQARLREVEPASSFGEVSRWRAGLESSPLPQLILDNIALFITDVRFAQHALTVGDAGT